jgi:predicted ATPase
LAAQRPVLLVLEDVHWIDPTSLDLIDRIIARVADLRVLLVVTFRPEFQPTWVGQPHVTMLTLSRLGRRDSASIIVGTANGKTLPDAVVEQILARTDGVPLFIEELTSTLLESGVLRETSDGYALDAPLPPRTVPGTLQASLVARLDRLAGAKEVAQIGAAIGREFSHDLIGAVSALDATDLDAALEQLAASGLVSRRGMPPIATYSFKHALVQDAAYDTLLKSRRRALHARIVDTLESQFPEIAERQPELLARHCTEAGLIEKAAGLWGSAGQRSLERSALAEAAEQLTRALDLIAALPATPALRRDQIKFQVALMTPLMHVKGYAPSELKSAAERAHLLIEQAEALGEPPEDPLLLFSVLFGFWVANYWAFKGDVVRDLATHFLALAEQQGSTVALMMGHRLMGTSLLFTGDIAQSRAHFDQATALYDPAEHLPLATRFGQDIRVSVLSNRSRAQWLLGYPEAALKDADDALNYAREVRQATTLMFALFQIAIPHMFCGNYSVVTARLQELLALAEEKGALFWTSAAKAFQGCALVLTGKTSDAAHVLVSGITAYGSTGATLHMPLWLSHLARAYAELGQFDDAWRCIGQATTLADTSKEKWYEAEVHRIAGEIALKSPEQDAGKAEAYFERALTVARQQQAKSWELRAAMSMARLWRQHGKPDEARDLLAPVYDWFTDGFDTLDLKQARALLS